MQLLLYSRFYDNRSTIKISEASLNIFQYSNRKTIRIAFSMVFNINYLHFVSSLSYAKHKYFCIFPWYSNSLFDLRMLVYLIIGPCMNLKRTTISEDTRYCPIMNELEAKSNLTKLGVAIIHDCMSADIRVSLYL